MRDALQSPTPASTDSGSDRPERQTDIDQRNAAFWDELCGTQLAQSLGVTDSSPESLKKFDDWYFDYYPYLEKHIPFSEMKGMKVLEIGLGYGTVSQRLAESGADYTGLDIAAGPVAMVNNRLEQLGLTGKACQGSILDAPFPDNTFDWVVAIGCFHHTGNLQRALEEARRVLKPGGKAMVMVYYAYSYRRWQYATGTTFRHFLGDKFKFKMTASSRSEKERAHYDASTKDGAGAPETAFASSADIKRLCADWSQVTTTLENVGQESIFIKWPRKSACRTAGPWMGLDIYCLLEK